MAENDLMREGERMMTICNACRYCEGFCAVWRAMEYRRAFPPNDMNYLANLCHDCGECYYACQYAPPHEFEVNPPLLFAKIRVQSFEKYAWPEGFAKIFGKNGVLTSLLLSVVLILLLGGVLSATGGGDLPVVTDGNFYKVAPHGLLVGLFGLVGLFVLASLWIGFTRFWNDIGEKLADFAHPSSLKLAAKEALRLEYLDDQGLGCTYPDDKHSQARRWLHHMTFYGFVLCFAATTTGFIYEYVFHWIAPYGYFSLPVAFGSLGGLSLTAGLVGLLVLKTRRNRDISDPKHCGIDIAFTVLLLLATVSGLALAAFREWPAMPVLLTVHLGLVLALFLVLPYSKFVHGIYRFAALVKYALERARKKALGV